ncbi:MAG: hypothetical protein F4239_04200 [Gammaproteobacteria bacterium]|nr:hypothetical protein [Gammaproteobacteria bacterium]MYD78111.1 hypothetical protein [Gammaproteobacteria bacterium]MYI90251.1 hypothetical protein [Gammaproteobacteria bacterium]
MGEELATWEMIVVGVLAVGLLFFVLPGLKRLNEEARKAEKDWPGFLLPIGAVVLLIVVLILFVV